MQNNVSTNVERIIAKIDNDFNPDNSDWIPRVGAWCIDAMSQLDILRTKKKKKKVTVSDRIAYLDCPINSDEVKIYDSNGCKIKEAGDSESCDGCPSTGKLASGTSDSDVELTPNTINYIENQSNKTANYVVAETVNDKFPYRYNVQHYKYGSQHKEHNYVIVDNNKIELNFDTDYIYIETDVIETTCSDKFGCELPVIPNNGLLIEAIAYYCMYKMLCRGYKHPVFNLNASQYGTNPYYMWTQLKEEAKRSIINNDDIDDASELFRSNFFINTFDTRE